MFRDVTERFSQSDISENSVMAALANIPILFWLPLIMKRSSAFVRYNANHGVWFLILSILGPRLLDIIPFFGGMLASIFGFAVTVLWIFMIICTVRGAAKELPIISEVKIIS